MRMIARLPAAVTLAVAITAVGFGPMARAAPAPGTITEFALPTANSGPRGIAAGPDGNLWFTEVSSKKLGQIATSGTVTEFAIPTPNSFPNGIAAGPDGNLWFTEFDAN